MRLISFRQNVDGPLKLETERLVLRRPQTGDFEQWAHLRSISADFLRPLEPAWTHDELSRGSFKARLRAHDANVTAGRALPWYLFSKQDDATLLGGITVSNIRRGVAQCGTIGYWMGKPYAGQGLMKEALRAVCETCFDHHHLNRLEAATVLHNVRSQRLLTSCGFTEEGVARDYLKINGLWEDHRLFARLARDVLR